MNTNNIIADLLEGKIKLSTVLFKLTSLPDLEKQEKDFLQFELNGYGGKVVLPTYRVLTTRVLVTSQNVYGQVKSGVELNFDQMREDIRNLITTLDIRQGILSLEKTLFTGNDTASLKVLMVPGQLAMLNELVQKNNPEANLIEGFYYVYPAQLQLILNEVTSKIVEKYGNRIVESRESLGKEKVDLIVNDDQLKSPVFVSYSWDNDDHKELVASFVNHLRKELGFDAKVDRLITQGESAPNFNDMMSLALSESNKVIVVLSEKYKEKADNNIGGVGKEYHVIIDEIDKIKNKYILCSFESLSSKKRDEITPTLLKGREIIDLKKDQGNKFENLIRKLNDTNEVTFDQVSEVKSELAPKKIKPFKL
jgi:hypothetical protein